MIKPQAIEYTTQHGHTINLDDPHKLVVEQGFKCINGGTVKHSGKNVRLMVRYDNKPELAAKIAAWLEDWKHYEASKAAEFARNVPGLAELEAAKDAASNEEYRYELELNRAMDSEGGFSPRSLDTSLRDRANKLVDQYPRAAMYLRAKANHHKSTAGNKAMDLIATGGSLDDAAEILTNWVPEESIWN
jgi:hypothetical protein